jgi:hypothetical protein
MSGWSEEDLKKARERITGASTPKSPDKLVMAKGKVQARDRGMNKTEVKYAQHLQREKEAGRISAFWFEAWKIRIADNCTWLPDFVVIDSDGMIEWHDTKAWWKKANKLGITDDAVVKMKAVAEIYPQVKVAATWEIDGIWHQRVF